VGAGFAGALLLPVSPVQPARNSARQITSAVSTCNQNLKGHSVTKNLARAIPCKPAKAGVACSVDRPGLNKE